MAGLSLKLEAYEKHNKMYGQPEYEMFLNDPDCSFGSDQNGNYKIDFKLDKCGTTVVQENGQLGNFSGLSLKPRPLSFRFPFNMALELKLLNLEVTSNDQK